MSQTLASLSFALTRSKHAARLLASVPKAGPYNFKHGGALWLYKSYEDWALHADMAVWEVPVGLTLLRNRSLIITKTISIEAKRAMLLRLSQLAQDVLGHAEDYK